MKNLRLSGKWGTGKTALIDDEDFNKVKKYKWNVDRKGYVNRIDFNKGNPINIKLHRFLLNAKKGEIIDHININKLDNRKINLRFCNHSQNAMNRKISIKNKSGYKGVSWDKINKKWRVNIKLYGKFLCRDRFANKEDAAKKYDEVAKKYFGEFSRTNF